MATARPSSDDNAMACCPICGGEMEDARHVMVECFYDVQEVAPATKKTTFFCEVDEDKSIFGVTRRYREGSRDRHVTTDNGTTEAGFRVMKIDVVQDPIPPIRLLEKTGYSAECCKHCRADFLEMFGKWIRGDLAANREHGEEANIPVRINGAVKMVTMAEYDEMLTKQHQEKAVDENARQFPFAVYDTEKVSHDGEE